MWIHNNFPRYLSRKIFYTNKEGKKIIVGNDDIYFIFPCVGVVDRNITTVFKKHSINIGRYSVENNRRLLCTGLKNKLQREILEVLKVQNE